jgi:hypothetical protein
MGRMTTIILDSGSRAISSEKEFSLSGIEDFDDEDGIPVSTAILVFTDIPVSTAIPVFTDIPVSTAIPVFTDIPVSTAIPVFTDIPVSTAAPAHTATLSAYVAGPVGSKHNSRANGACVFSK